MRTTVSLLWLFFLSSGIPILLVALTTTTTTANVRCRESIHSSHNIFFESGLFSLILAPTIIPNIPNIVNRMSPPSPPPIVANTKASHHIASPSSSKKRPRSTDDMDEVSSVKLPNSTSEQSTNMSPPVDDPKRLRLEAIFLPKFENEKSNHQIRSEMIHLVEDKKGYLEVTLKHSGSLVLWSGGPRYYSKNAISNQFTLVAEVLLRQHFERAWRTHSDQTMDWYQECSRYLQEKRLTCSFEVVTAILGDHGDIPNRDFVILTAVADRAAELFYSTPEVLALAQRFRLPHNDSWAFATAKSTQALFDLYDTSRETGLAGDTVASLTAAAEAHVASMYPHTVFQGDILEGFIIRYIPIEQSFEAAGQLQERLQRLATTAQCILQETPPSMPSSFQVLEISAASPVLGVDIRAIFDELDGFRQGQDAATHLAKKLEGLLRKTDNSIRRSVHRIAGRDFDLAALTKHLTAESTTTDRETHRIAELLQTVSDLNKQVSYSLAEEQLASHPKRVLCTIHVHHDQTFLRFQRAKDPEGMNLFRGFCVEIGSNVETASSPNIDHLSQAVPQKAVFPPSSTTIEAPVLMLKMKLLPYMIRTFMCRNQLRIVRQDGPAAFLRVSKKLLDRWEISEQGKKRWIPFLERWAVYVRTAIDQPPRGDENSLPPLTDFCYLKHLNHFTHLYEAGQAPALESTLLTGFRGLVCVVAPVVESAEHAARALAKVLDCHSIQHLADAAQNDTVQGVICFGHLADYSKRNREFLTEAEEYLAVVDYGCADEDIESTLSGKPESDIKKYKGMRKRWQKQRCAQRIYLAKASVPQVGCPESADFQEVVDMINIATEAAPAVQDDSEKQPGLLVFFPGIPGCGKSSLLESMGTELRERLATEFVGEPRNVEILVGDELGSLFWQKVVKCRKKDTSCVLIADRNAPEQSWSKIGEVCTATRGVPVAILPDKSARQTTTIIGSRDPDGTVNSNISHYYPFSLKFLALCMARVLQRDPSSHIGKLDSGTPTAAMVVIKFYTLYRRYDADDLPTLISTRLNAMPAIELKTFDSADEGLPKEVEDVLTEALQLQRGYDFARQKVKSDDEIIKDMEARLRQCIKSHSDDILSNGVDVSESKNAFLDQLAQRIKVLDIEDRSHEMNTEDMDMKIKLVSVDVQQTQVQNAIQAQASGKALQFLENAMNFAVNTHVTMQFWKDTTQQSVRQKWDGLVGQDVALLAKALLWDGSVAALAVEVAHSTEGGSKLPVCENKFPHITVWVADGAEASMSNKLPSLVEQGAAERFEFSSAIPLSGTITFWDFENTPLPFE